MPLSFPAVPVDAINLRARGAMGIADATSIINQALVDAKAQGKAVYAPAGTYNHSGVIIVDSVTLFGDGDVTNFVSTNVSGTANNAIRLTGTGPKLFNVKHTSLWASSRQTTNQSASVHVNTDTSNFRVENVTVAASASVAVIAVGAHDGVIRGVVSDNTLADPIHLTGGCYNITVTECVVNNGGDDGIAVVSYLSNPTICRNINIVGNHVNGGSARGITVVGGRDVTITGNTIKDKNNAGIYLSSEASYNTYEVDNVVVSNNVIRNCGTIVSDNPGSFKIAGRSGYPVKNIVARGNVITDCGGEGLLITGDAPSANSDIIFSENQVKIADTATRGQGLKLIGCQNVKLLNNIVLDAWSYGIYGEPDRNSGYLDIIGNTITNCNRGAGGSVDAINIQGGTTYLPTSVTVAFNRQYNGSGSVERAIEISNTVPCNVFGNVCEDSDFYVPSNTQTQVGYGIKGVFGNLIRDCRDSGGAGRTIAIGAGAHSGVADGAYDFNNLAIGYNALSGAITSTRGCVAIGYLAISSLTSGGDWTAIGASSGRYAIGGSWCVAVGTSALAGLSTAAPTGGQYNTALGYGAGKNITGTPNRNVYIGSWAGGGESVNGAAGSDNTMVGAYCCTKIETSDFCTFVGRASGALLTTGDYNTVMGYATGNKLTTGSNNTIIGRQVASTTLATGSNNLLIGTSSSVDTPAADSSNVLNIGNVVQGDLSTKSVSIGGGALATNATGGFAYIPTCAGIPTGTPETRTGFLPMVIDSTNNKLYVYVGGTWTAMN